MGYVERRDESRQSRSRIEHGTVEIAKAHGSAVLIDRNGERAKRIVRRKRSPEERVLGCACRCLSVLQCAITVTCCDRSVSRTCPSWDSDPQTCWYGADCVVATWDYDLSNGS